MAQQTINIGTSANKGDGDPIRVAFDKVNDNFTDLYTRVVVLEGGGVAVAFGDITSTPTTLSGYGITDAATSAQGALADTALQAETISLTTLKTEVAASADFADFQVRIAAL